MFSTIKSIIKTLSIFSLFATLVVAGLSNVNASAQCTTAAQINANPACRGVTTTNGTTGGASGLTPNVCPNNQCPVINNAANLKIADKTAVSNFILSIARFFTFIAAAIAVLFIVYGGYLYIADGGDDKRAATGKKVLINALIGLAVAILAYTIVTFIGSTLEGNLVGSIVGNQ
jgi:Type IV secretion system pilin